MKSQSRRGSIESGKAEIGVAGEELQAAKAIDFELRGSAQNVSMLRQSVTDAGTDPSQQEKAPQSTMSTKGEGRLKPVIKKSESAQGKLKAVRFDLPAAAAVQEAGK